MKQLLPDYATRGTFEMTMSTPDRLVKTKCYLVGAIAAHKVKGLREWKLSHAATGTGLPGCYGRTLTEALRLARAIDGVIDWSAIKRGSRLGSVLSMTKAKGQAVASMASSFNHIVASRSGTKAKAPVA